MKTRCLALAIVALIGLSVPVCAESRRIMSGSAGGGKYQFFYDSFLDPATPALENMGGGTIGGEGTIHRFMSDSRQHVYFGYDVQIEPLSEPNIYRITFSQLTAESVRGHLGDDRFTWAQLPGPYWGGPAIRTVRAGEVLALDLLTNKATGQKIIDYVSIKNSFDPTWQFIYETGPPQDFRVEDATLKLNAPHLTINGEQEKTGPEGIQISGPLVWFYVPARGRFILSLLPNSEFRFVKAGEIRGSTLSFNVGDDVFNVAAAERIAPGQRAFNLYVLHEPEWRPSDSESSLFFWGAADSPSYLFQKSAGGTQQ